MLNKCWLWLSLFLWVYPWPAHWNLLIWKLSHIEAPRLFSITWRRRIEEHVQSLALNSILAFSCYLPASHMFSHKLWGFIPYHHLLYLCLYHYPQRLQWPHVIIKSSSFQTKSTSLFSGSFTRASYPWNRIPTVLCLLPLFTRLLLSEEPWWFIT